MLLYHHPTCPCSLITTQPTSILTLRQQFFGETVLKSQDWRCRHQARSAAGICADDDENHEMMVPAPNREFRLDRNFLSRWNTIDNKVAKFCRTILDEPVFRNDICTFTLILLMLSWAAANLLKVQPIFSQHGIFKIAKNVFEFLQNC